MPKSSVHLPWRRRFEHVCRNSLVRLLGFLLQRRRPAAPTETPISKILIVRTSHNLGDVVMAGAMLDECRALFPHARIALLANARLSALFHHHDALDQLYEFHPRWFLHPFDSIKLLGQIRREHFDLAIDCANIGAPSLNNWLLTRLTNAPHRVGFRERGSEAFLTTLVDATFDRHFISVQLQLLTPFARPSAFRLPRLILTAQEKDAARKLLDGSPRPRAVIFVPEPRRKCWTLDLFLKFAEVIAANEVSLVLAFGPNDPRRDCEEIRQLLARHPRRARVLPAMPLRPFAAALSQCDLFVSNDCGPMHVAVAVGTPTVSVFLFANDWAHGYHDGVRHFAIRADTEEHQLQRALECALAVLKRETAAV
jgi:ADP-heptose:LPS heptosyltransferase